MRAGRVALRSFFVLAALTGVDLALARFVLADGRFLGVPVAPFDPPLFSPAQRAALERIEAQLAGDRQEPGKFDAELGWCNKPDSGFGDFRYDWTGARIGAEPLARTKRPGTRRIVAVGCSMTHGEEVRPGETWCAGIDALREDLEVANLGVAAYGIDQALLRLRRDGWPLEPDEVWLGVLPAAALRVTTLFRPLLDHWSLDVAFKPRFVLDEGGGLSRVPNPARSLADEVRLLRDQRAFLDAVGGNDTWVARAETAYAPRGSSWTHWFLSTRLLLTAWEKRGRELESCFRDEGEFGRLFTALVQAMGRECAARGAAFRLLVLPGKDDLLDRIRDDRRYWEEWVRRRRDEGLQVLDLTDALLGSGVPLERLFAPHGHYSPAAGEIVAQALARELPR